MADLSFPDPPLRAGSVVLREWRESDAPAIANACSHASVVRFLVSLPSPYTEDDARSWLASQEASRLAGTSLEMAVADAATDGMLGSLATRLNQRTLTANIGYWLALEAQGHGYMTTAVRLMCDWLFETVGVGRIELTTDPENYASQRVAQRCGFQQEGRLRAHLLHLHAGERRDSLMWSLLPGELVSE
jgi:RimJ/RimL family protein N-acetyltransferase